MSAAKETQQVLRDLDERLTEKAALLAGMAGDSTDPHERWRLRAKAEGVRLSQSFVHEAIRAEAIRAVS